MTQLILHCYYPTAIAATRVRRSWTGKLILQIRRHQKVRKLSNPRDPGPVEDAGLTEWTDANGNDASEVAEVMAFLREKVEG